LESRLWQIAVASPTSLRLDPMALGDCYLDLLACDPEHRADISCVLNACFDEVEPNHGPRVLLTIKTDLLIIPLRLGPVRC
jgi:hypothetical protein